MEERYNLGRRKLLTATASAIAGSGLIVKSVSAESNVISRTEAPIINADLTYSGDFEQAAGIEVMCGEPNHIIHNSDLFIGDVDIRPYMNTSPLVLANSHIATENEKLTSNSSNRLPVKGDYNNRNIRIQNNISLPDISFKNIGPESATLIAEEEEIDIHQGEEESIDLNAQTIQIEIPGETVNEVEYDLGGDVAMEGSEEPDVISIREVETVEVTATPTIQVLHHGKGNLYGIENGVALPMSDNYPMSRRAIEVGGIESTISRSNEISTSNRTSRNEEVIIVRRGAKQ